MTHYFLIRNISYWLVNPLLFPILQYFKTLCIVPVKDIIHILFASLVNYCRSFLIGILRFYLWFTGHTAAIFIYLKVMLLSEYFPPQSSLPPVSQNKIFKHFVSNIQGFYSLSSSYFSSDVSQY